MDQIQANIILLLGHPVKHESTPASLRLQVSNMTVSLVLEHYSSNVMFLFFNIPFVYKSTSGKSFRYESLFLEKKRKEESILYRCATPVRLMVTTHVSNNLLSHWALRALDSKSSCRTRLYTGTTCPFCFYCSKRDPVVWVPLSSDPPMTAGACQPNYASFHHLFFLIFIYFCSLLIKKNKLLTFSTYIINLEKYLVAKDL